MSDIDDDKQIIEGEFEVVNSQPSHEHDASPTPSQSRTLNEEEQARTEAEAFVDWIENPFDPVSGEPSDDAVILAGDIKNSKMPKQVGGAFNLRVSKVEAWQNMSYRSPSNFAPESEAVVTPVLENLYQKMVDIGLSKEIRDLNQTILDTENPASIDGILDRFADEKSDKIIRFEAETLLLRQHVEKNFKTNGYRSDGKLKVGLGHDLSDGQKNELLLFLDSAIDMANDLKKGQHGRNAREIHDMMGRVNSRRVQKSSVSSGKSLTGLSYAYEFATNAEISSNKNKFFPGTKSIVKGEWVKRAARAIDEECYTNFQNGKPVQYDTIPGNIEAKWQNDLLAGVQRKADGDLQRGFFKAGVQEKYTFLGELSVSMRAHMGNETIHTLKRMVRLTGDNNKKVIPPTGDFDEGAGRLIANGTLAKNEYNRFYLKKARDIHQNFEDNVSGAEDLASHLFPNTRAHFFGVNRKNQHHAEAANYKWNYLKRFPGTDKYSLPGLNTFNPMIRHFLLKKPLAYTLGAHESKSGTITEFGIDLPSYDVKKSDKKSEYTKEQIERSRPKYIYRAHLNVEGTEKESAFAPMRRMAVRVGSVAVAIASPAVPALVAATPLFISDIANHKKTGGLGIPFDVPLWKSKKTGERAYIPTSRVRAKFTPLGKFTAKVGAIIAVPVLAANLALNGSLPDFNISDSLQNAVDSAKSTLQVETPKTPASQYDLDMYDRDGSQNIVPEFNKNGNGATLPESQYDLDMYDQQPSNDPTTIPDFDPSASVDPARLNDKNGDKLFNDFGQKSSQLALSESASDLDDIDFDTPSSDLVIENDMA